MLVLEPNVSFGFSYERKQSVNDEVKWLLDCFQGDHFLGLLAENQIFAWIKRCQFFQATRRCFDIVSDAEPNQPAGGIPFKEVESGYRHVTTSYGT